MRREINVDRPQLSIRFDYDGKPYEHTFYNYSDLTNYFRWCPDRGALVGFGRFDGPSLCTNGLLILRVKGSAYSFTHIDQLKRFFNEYPDLASTMSFSG